ncbi:hypothetical protein A1507_17680 [Methylomonas koyamae]|uniref:Uncharacterized protein n=1 Tax=Methylomonas koyamae TaxID=702114 RepID=A0A177N7N2_9GAMM|nr:hypothetical protein [Methylomonas koyamae]OAI13199.1 hypothetical protein A1507_17680 [Methylomonas koyamae]
MNEIASSDRSLNRIPSFTDWSRYDSPTVLRRYGPGFLDKALDPDTESRLFHRRHSYADLEILTETFGGICTISPGCTLLLFDDARCAQRCHAVLKQRKLEGLLQGCHIRIDGDFE